jgi:hypothetical protein
MHSVAGYRAEFCKTGVYALNRPSVPNGTLTTNPIGIINTSEISLSAHDEQIRRNSSESRSKHSRDTLCARQI